VRRWRRCDARAAEYLAEARSSSLLAARFTTRSMHHEAAWLRERADNYTRESWKYRRALLIRWLRRQAPAGQGSETPTVKATHAGWKDCRVAPVACPPESSTVAVRRPSHWVRGRTPATQHLPRTGVRSEPQPPHHPPAPGPNLPGPPTGEQAWGGRAQR
jgi:hypothetical protein